MKDKPIPFFKRFVIQNFPFIEEDFDALTNYQLFCKVVEYLNKVIGSQNEVTQQMEYVLNYFNNLDVQDEINNKLDQMAESGELTDLIAGYLNLRGILAYNTVAEMKAADNLVDGSFAETYGFYAKGDMGGAKYKIRAVTNADTVDEMTLIALSDQSLVAELMLEDTMNVRQFGAKGDGTTDDTTKIQKTLDTVKTVFVPDGTYMVNAETTVALNSHNHLILSENATIKAITNSSTTYYVLSISNISDVIVEGGTISGDKTTHTGETGEWGHCIRIVNGASNVIIRDIKLIDAWGDGLYVNNASDVRTENVIVDNARRNGYSIISATNFHSLNDTIKNVIGTAPQAGVDIEPNEATDVLQNIVFENTVIKDCKSSGFNIYLMSATAETPKYTIDVNDLHIIGSSTTTTDGIKIDKNQYIKGYISFDNPTVESVRHLGITGNILYSECPIKINRPKIIDYDSADASGISIGSGMYFHNDSDVDGGNIEIIEPMFTSNKTSQDPRDLYVAGRASYPMKNIKYINPMMAASRRLYLSNCENVVISDVAKELIHTPTGNSTYSDSALFSVLNTLNYTANRTVTLSTSCPTGYEITITRGNNYTPTIVFSDTQKCYPLATTDNPTIVLGSIGSSITLRKISATEWVVVNQVGTITVS